MKLVKLLFSSFLLLFAHYSWAAAPNINVLVAYTPQAAKSLGDVNSAVQTAIGQMNQSFANSFVSLGVSLAGTVPITNEYPSSSTALDGLLGNASVKDRRDSANADVVVLVGHFSDACGLATTILATANTAFVVVSDSCLISNFSMTHEIGHVLGARHDPQSDSTSGSNHGFWYNYSFRITAANYSGIGEVSIDYCDKTIMSYDPPAATVHCGSANRINYWSNPNVKITRTQFYGPYAGQTTSGAIGNFSCCNDAATLNQNGPLVAQFRNTKLGAGIPDTIINIINIITNIFSDDQ